MMIQKKSKYHKEKWFVDINQVRTDYIVIENLAQFMAPEVPALHPDHPDYGHFWSWETKKCIEGIWGKEFEGYRYMPGNLYFFGNYGILQHTDENKQTFDMKPLIVDFIWDYAYDSMVVKGFSGWSKDPVFSSHETLKAFKEGELDIEYVDKECFDKEGKLKKYIDPWKNVSRIHHKKMGLPLYGNPTQNELILGTRGCAKSYWVAIGEIEYRFVFGGAKRYNKMFIDGRLKAEIVVGAADVNYSSEMLEKFEHSQNCKADNTNSEFVKWFGIWTERINDEEELVHPCPFHKRHKGNLDCPNKKNPYRHEYDIFNGSTWEPRGTKSKIGHVNYSPKKPKSEQAGVGGRVDLSDVEEVGLLENYIGVLGANETTVSRPEGRFGVQWAQGTSGNVEYVQAAKKVMLNPQDYHTLSFPNQFGKEGKNGRIARFVPYYVTLFKYKDKNGNTDFKGAIQAVNVQRAKFAKSDDPRVLRDEQMNRPCYVREMWISPQGYYLPYDEAVERERELMEGNLYKHLAMPVSLIWDPKSPQGVKTEYLHDVEPIVDWPIPKDLKDPSGFPVIYEKPTPIKGVIPPDMYAFIGHDPYVEEDIDRGGSLGVTYILKNPKYITQTGTGNIIVASYIGKPIGGLEVYYENQEKLMALYGNPINGLWYEKNRGEYCRNYYIRKKKLNLLALTPQYVQGANINLKKVTSTGFLVGNRVSKKNQLKLVYDWALEETETMEGGQAVVKRNIFRIPCLFLIRQFQQYNLEENFDGVSAFVGCIVGLKEYESVMDQKQKITSQRVNVFGAVLNNPNIFRHDTTQGFGGG